MKYKGKTDPKFTTQLVFVCNNASWQLHEKQSTLHFATNTTTDTHQTGVEGRKYIFSSMKI